MGVLPVPLPKDIFYALMTDRRDPITVGVPGEASVGIQIHSLGSAVDAAIDREFPHEVWPLGRYDPVQSGIDYRSVRMVFTGKAEDLLKHQLVLMDQFDVRHYRRRKAALILWALRTRCAIPV